MRCIICGNISDCGNFHVRCIIYGNFMWGVSFMGTSDEVHHLWKLFMWGASFVGTSCEVHLWELQMRYKYLWKLHVRCIIYGNFIWGASFMGTSYEVHHLWELVMWGAPFMGTSCEVHHLWELHRKFTICGNCSCEMHHLWELFRWDKLWRVRWLFTIILSNLVFPCKISPLSKKVCVKLTSFLQHWNQWFSTFKTTSFRKMRKFILSYITHLSKMSSIK